MGPVAMMELLQARRAEIDGKCLAKALREESSAAHGAVPGTGRSRRHWYHSWRCDSDEPPADNGHGGARLDATCVSDGLVVAPEGLHIADHRAHAQNDQSLSGDADETDGKVHD